MKKFMNFTTFLLIAGTSFSQEPNKSKTLISKDYLTKSKNQKIAGKIFLGLGGALLISVIPVGISDFRQTLAKLLLTASVVSFAGGIYLLIRSNKNKRIATSGIGYLKIENAPSVQKMGIAFQSYPAISIRINLR